MRPAPIWAIRIWSASLRAGQPAQRCIEDMPADGGRFARRLPARVLLDHQPPVIADSSESAEDAGKIEEAAAKRREDARTQRGGEANQASIAQRSKHVGIDILEVDMRHAFTISIHKIDGISSSEQ